MAELGDILDSPIAQGFAAGFTGTPLSRIQDNRRSNQLQQQLADQAKAGNPLVGQGRAGAELAVRDPKAFEAMNKALDTQDTQGQKSLFAFADNVHNAIALGQFSTVSKLISRRIKNGKALGVKNLDKTEEFGRKWQQAIAAGDSEEIGKLTAGMASLRQLGVQAGFLPPGPQDKIIKQSEVSDTGQITVQKPGGEFETKDVKGFKGKPSGESAGTTSEIETFKFLTEDLPEKKIVDAKLIELGLEPRAVGNALQTISKLGIEKEIGDTSAVIKEREKFGAMTGASRAKAVDKGFERIVKIDSGIRNMDRALGAIKEGAGVGSIEKIFPSFKAATVLLDNIQGAMALDVVGATTFGALSKGELDLAKAIALPTGLDSAQLIQYLKDKRAAQMKLRDYFNEQIQFLDQGGTVAGFLRKKERESGGQAQPGTDDLSLMSTEELQQLRASMAGGK